MPSRTRGAIFFFNDTATTEIYTLSLHDALPISARPRCLLVLHRSREPGRPRCRTRDRKSTRLNSSHQIISYAVFCLKKKQPPLLATRPADRRPFRGVPPEGSIAQISSRRGALAP